MITGPFKLKREKRGSTTIDTANLNRAFHLIEMLATMMLGIARALGVNIRAIFTSSGLVASIVPGSVATSSVMSFDVELSSRYDEETEETVRTVILKKGYRKVIGADYSLVAQTELDVTETGKLYMVYTYTNGATAGEWGEPTFSATASVPIEDETKRVIVFADVTVDGENVTLFQRLHGDVAVFDAKNCVDCT